MKNNESNYDELGQYSEVTPENLDKLVTDVVKLLLIKGVTIATAESCTGGLLSELITSVPGASRVFEIGVCTYSNKIKHEYLGVPKSLFKEYGAVSSQVALAMVSGLQKQSGADICISVTGTAGPGGGTPEKPVGTVYVGISCGRKQIVKLLKLWELDDLSRDNIRLNAAYRIFEFLEQMLGVMPDSLPEKRPGGARGGKKTYKDVLRGLLPWKGDPVFQVVRKSIFLISVIVFTICLYMIIDYYWENYKNRQLGEDLQSIYQEAEQDESPVVEDEEVVLYKNWELKDGAKLLLDINKDVVGYINIPGTDISYPVVQRRQETDGNEYYLNRNINEEEAKAGTIFLDWRNYFDYVVDGTKVLDNSQNLVIYGHEMKDGSMFGSLKNYKDINGYYSENPIIELSSNYENYKYKIFAYFIIDSEDESETKYDCWNTLNFDNEEHFYEFVNNARKRSFILSDVDVRYGDQLLTLSTCNGVFETSRFIVMARLVRDGENPLDGTKDPEENTNILWPSIYYNWNENTYDPEAEFDSYPLTSG